MSNCGVKFQHVDSTDHFIDRAEAKLCHDLPSFLSHHEQIIHNMLWLALELLAKYGILSRDADRACIQVTLSHHDTTQSDQRGRRKTKLFCSQHGCHNYVATCLKLSVSLKSNSTTQIVHLECLVSFCDPEFPWQTSMFDAGQWGGSRSAFEAGNQDIVGMTLGHTRRNRSDANF